MEAKTDIKYKWYVVHCHSGYEKKVADAILNEAKNVDLDQLISEVSVPTQAVVEVRRGVRINSEKKVFPWLCFGKNADE
jgi:transcriptional antiterminator NusG